MQTLSLLFVNYLAQCGDGREGIRETSLNCSFYVHQGVFEGKRAGDDRQKGLYWCLNGCCKKGTDVGENSAGETRFDPSKGNKLR